MGNIEATAQLYAARNGHRLGKPKIPRWDVDGAASGFFSSRQCAAECARIIEPIFGFGSKIDHVKELFRCRFGIGRKFDVLIAGMSKVKIMSRDLNIPNAFILKDELAVATISQNVRPFDASFEPHVRTLGFENTSEKIQGALPRQNGVIGATRERTVLKTKLQPPFQPRAEFRFSANDAIVELGDAASVAEYSCIRAIEATVRDSQARCDQ